MLSLIDQKLKTKINKRKFNKTYDFVGGVKNNFVPKTDSFCLLHGVVGAGVDDNAEQII